MGLIADKRKLIRVTTNLSQLKGDLAHVVSPNARAMILNLISQRQVQINQLMGKINLYEATHAQAAQPLPEKKTPPPKVTTIVKKKKAVDELNRIRVK